PQTPFGVGAVYALVIKIFPLRLFGAITGSTTDFFAAYHRLGKLIFAFGVDAGSRAVQLLYENLIGIPALALVMRVYGAWGPLEWSRR
ncbi:hypothetical protein, partial [Pseudomonas syringae group genomosp. 7]